MDTAPDSVPDDGPDTTEEAVPEPAELQEECCTRQAAEETPEVVPTETIVPLGQIGGDAPAEKERWPYAS